MKLSEAMLVGSTVVHPEPGHLIAEDQGAGCALGMAAVGLGLKTGPSYMPGYELHPASTMRTGNAELVYPWLLTKDVRRPCRCWLVPHEWKFMPRHMMARDILVHLFDQHVFGKKDWTMDDLAAWIRSVEPEELIQQVPTIDLPMEKVDLRPFPFTEEQKEIFRAEH